MEEDRIRTYKAVGIVTWEIDLADNIDKEDALKQAKDFLDSIVVNTPGVRTAIRIDKLKRAKSRVKRLGDFEPGKILSQITREDIKTTFRVNDEDYHVKLNSQRYFVFRNSLACMSCGLVGTKMILEIYPNQTSPHFNLYAEENGELILMTKDHIHSKASGGQDRHSNYQTMCAICNNLKGSSRLPLEGIRELRKIHDEHKGKSSRRTFTALVNEVKERYHCLGPPKKPKKGDMWATVDLNIYRQPDGTFRGQSVYTKVNEGEECVACIKAGEPLEPVAPLDSEDKILRIKFNDGHFQLYQGLAQYDDPKKGKQ